MLRPISVVDWDACRLPHYDREALLLAFKNVELDIGDEHGTPAEVVARYDSAFKLQQEHKFTEAVELYRQVEELAQASGNPVLAMMAQHQRFVCTQTGHMLIRELALLINYLPTLYEELEAPTAHAMRLTVAMKEFESLVRSNHMLLKAQEQGRYARTRLSAIEEMIAECSFERAENFARETARVLAESLGEDHWWRAILLLKQAECLKALNKLEEARAVLKVCDMIFAEWCCSEEHILFPYVRQFVVLSRSVGA